jgi:hypothetical protein
MEVIHLQEFPLIPSFLIMNRMMDFSSFVHLLTNLLIFQEKTNLKLEMKLSSKKEISNSQNKLSTNFEQFSSNFSFKFNCTLYPIGHRQKAPRFKKKNFSLVKKKFNKNIQPILILYSGLCFNNAQYPCKQR